MLNYIWIFMMVVSFIASAFTGRMNETLQAFLDSGKKSFEFAVSTGSIMVLWSGIMAVAEKSRLTEKFALILSPLISVVFRNVKKKSAASRAISMNMVANFLGLSNAATPLGIQAMRELAAQGDGKKASFDMCMLAVINSASIQLIPSTLIAMRSAAGSVFPGEIILPVWIVSFITALTGIISVKICGSRDAL